MSWWASGDDGVGAGAPTYGRTGSSGRATAWRVFPVLLVAAVACLGQARAAQEIFTANPWEREMSLGLVVDQEQLEAELVSGQSVCQVFTPTVDRLERLDIVTKNRTDPAPGEIRLWPWKGTYEDSTQGEPLWKDALQFHGQDAPYLRHYFPRVELEPGLQYLIECSRIGEWFYIAGVQHDVYPDGFVVTSGRERRDWDLWFRTFGPAPEGQGGEPTPRPLPELPLKTPTAPREPAEVTREIYLELVREHVNRSWESWEREKGHRAAELMYYAGFLFRHADETQWAERVPTWLRDAETHLQEHEDYGGAPWYVEHMGWGIRWFRGNELWSDDAEQVARRVMLTATRRLAGSLERGAMNRTMWDVHCTRLAADLFPDAPDAVEWRRFSDEAWHDWADYDDTDEDSSHYNAVFLHFMLGYARLADKLDLFERPGMRQFMDRYRDIITPSGMMVGWGDSVGCGADWGGWIAAFEAAASQTRDGTYKWAAHKLLDGHRRSILEDEPLLKGYEDMHSMPLAYLLADDDVKPVEPALRSGIHATTYPRYNPPQLRREQELTYYSLGDRKAPWKLVMRDSPAEDAYYALMGLLPGGGHGHCDAPALLSLFANGTMLMHDTAYFHKSWVDHNLLYGVRAAGGTLGEAPGETEVRAFAETDTLCYADIAWRDYAGWGMGFRREILFVKGLGWWVRDRTEAEEECEWFLGPLWHVDRVLGRGETWFDIDYPVPMSFAWPIANGTDHLLVYFAPKLGATVDYGDMTHRVDETKPWYSSAPWAVYQCEGRVQLSPDRQAHYDSLLIPLREGESADAVAQEIEVLLDEPAAGVIRLRRGGTTWTIALNNDGRALEVGPATSDARAIVVGAAPGAEPFVEKIER